MRIDRITTRPSLRRAVTVVSTWDTTVSTWKAGVSAWLAARGVRLTRISLGIVFVWFGGLKLFPGLSPAEVLAGNTLRVLTGGLADPAFGVPVLGAWEFLMGFGLLTGRCLRLTLVSFFAHMAGTMTPLFLFPDVVFVRFPYALSFEGQYIAKNLVLVSAALVVGAGTRGRSGSAAEVRVRSGTLPHTAADARHLSSAGRLHLGDSSPLDGEKGLGVLSHRHDLAGVSESVERH